MRYFPELLVLTLIISCAVFVYVAAQIAIIIIASGVVDPFVMGFILGFLTPIVIAVEIFRLFPIPSSSPWNTSMNNFLGWLR